MHHTCAASNAPARDIDGFRSRWNSVIGCEDLYAIESREAFSARLEGVQLGAVDVFRYDGQGVRGGSRSMRHIRSNPADDFLLILPLNVPMELSQHHNRNIIRPGTFAFLATNKPYEGRCGEPPYHLYSELMLKVPGALLRQRIPQVDKYCAVPVDANTGAGRVMRAVIEALLAEGRTLSGIQARLFGSALLDSIGAATADAAELRLPHRSSRQQAHEGVRLKALAFIEGHLSDPSLDTAKIAAHCHVSLRHLHASFESASIAVGALVREMRLQRCRADLMNPVLGHECIIEIAMRWGFSSSGSFTRAYRRRFGAAPSEERGA